MEGGAGTETQFAQNVIVMRHGDRLDNFEPLWVTTSDRPWDPPLTDAGKIRAWSTGKKLRKLDFTISRVFVSPFLRCLQTASHVIAALCATDDITLKDTSDGVPLDLSRLKVSIEHGLCEMLNCDAISSELVPQDLKWFPKIVELTHIFPVEIVDHSIPCVYQEFPKWQEGTNEARSRYKCVFHELANKFPQENLLIITHGEGVGVAASTFLKDALIYEVEYCAYAHLRRTITFNNNEESVPRDFEMLNCNNVTGICWQEGSI